MASPTFVGRGMERSRLESALERAAAGEPSLVLVGGDAGIGKTRLLGEFVAGARDALVLSGGCLDLGEAALPYAPVVEALRALSRQLGPQRLRTLVTGPRRELVRLLPGIEVERAVPSGEAAGQARLFEAVLSTLEALGKERPVVLAVEDLHWADRSTLALLEFLARNLGRGRVLLVATYRTEELHRRPRLQAVLGELSRLPWVERLELVPFDRDELVEQLTAILGRLPDAEVIEEIAFRSEGNAFYAEELLAARGRSDGQLPATLRDILASRLAELPETAQEVLRIAAAASRSVDHRLLEEVADLPAADLRDGLREAVAHQALVMTPDGRGYRFRHALVQEAVHDALLPGERRRWHAAFAAALERDPSLAAGGPEGVDAELAHHWSAAHDLERAFRASLAAAETAMGQYAYTEACHHDELALQLWDRVGAAARDGSLPRYEVLRRAARAAALAGDPGRALAHHREAIAVAGEEVPPEVRAGLLGELSHTLYEAGQGEEALAASEASLAAMPVAPSRERAYALAWRGALLMLVSRFEDAIAPSREAVEVARAVGARAEESRALNSLGTAIADCGDLAEGVALLRDSLRLAKEVGDAVLVLNAFINLGAAADFGGRYDESVAIATEGLRWAEDTGVTGATVDFLRVNLVGQLCFRGRWDEADQQLEKVRQPPRDGVDAVHLSNAAGRLRAGQGRFEDAHEHLRRGHEAMAGVVDPQYHVPLAQVEALLALWEHRPEDARRAADRVIEVDRLTWWADLILPLAAWAEADLAQRSRATGDRDAREEAERRVDHLLDTVHDLAGRERLGVAWSERLRSSIVQIEAERTRAHGDDDPEAWRRAMACCDEHGPADTAVYLCWRLAEALLQHDDRDEAAAVLRQAHRRAAELGARPLREELEALARRARIRLPGVDTLGDGGLGLTPRERDVLVLLAQGLTNRAIGEKLYIAESTASVHVSHILTKLAVSNRGEAAALAHRLGLAPPG
jgi:DNA-binding CsgD family transcriptional regulator/tetratricopeptide (TPR) repeat protein